ncbi:MAG: 3-hydroxyacyl-CoA dehydrogenase, partial [Microcella sp.]|nr:3-hydroxyacyl-CoA dehydrogenase [Microcella sp.]
SKGIDKKALEIVAKHRPEGAEPYSVEQLTARLEDGLADEIHRMLDDGVVEAAEDIDLCMILGAGWPFQMGGVTPFLDRVGASERAFGGTFHEPRIRGIR